MLKVDNSDIGAFGTKHCGFENRKKNDFASVSYDFLLLYTSVGCRSMVQHLLHGFMMKLNGLT